MSDNNAWIERAHAIARTQANYVWLLFVTGLFYFSLSKSTGSPCPQQATPVIPFVGVPLDPHLVLLTAPLVLSFLVLAFSGAVRAFKHASEAACPNQKCDPWYAEKLDDYPNAIDMVVYHTFKTRPWKVNIVHFGYPFYLTVFLVEAAWLWRISFPVAGIADIVISIASFIVWSIACWQTLHGWYERGKDVKEGKHLKKESIK
jgi:hypothetical protein